MKNRILLLDDDTIVLESFKYMMSRYNYGVSIYSDVKKCLDDIKDNDYSLILTDIRMPKIDGSEFVREVLKIRPDSYIYLLTSYPEDNIVKTALELGAKGLMEKPFQLSKIISIMNRL
ncbi:MAG: hypothetical protein B6229_06475 [Spirochaetaceae bacterium 4572_7]|nr:MAG: hypothetical protein B6229_06475 [Spirochaetaceae bacterium 4572_7]